MNTSSKLAAFAAVGLVGSFSIAGCDLDVPDLNNPGLGELQDTPTAALVNSACTGLIIGNRGNTANENGYVAQLALLGREAFNFDAADPRYISEMFEKPLDRASPFGGNFWGGPYTDIRLANIVLAGVDKVAEFADADKAAIRGFAHTIQALDLLVVINAHDTNGAVIDTDHPLGAALGPIASKADTFAKIVQLLDTGAQDLTAAGKSFTFPLSSGYHNDDAKLTFDTPAGFRKLNRAIRARVAVYLKDYAGALAALGESFIDDVSPAIPFGLGAYHAYSTGSGDSVNGLINTNIYAHPTFTTDAQKNGTTIDARYTRKIDTAAKPGANGGLASTIAFSKLYSSPSSPVPIIRNEELILLKAEALFFSGMTPEATTELNLVRVQSGGLAALAPTADAATFTTELLYERRFSLAFEGGHRWIDLRRFGIQLPIDRPTDMRNVRYPIPQAECDSRPGDPACALTSL